MQRLLLIVTVALAITAAWLFLAPQESTEPTEVVISDQERQQAQSHIEQLTANADQPIEIGRASSFVSANQLLLLPENQVLSDNIELEMELNADLIDAAAATAYAVDVRPSIKRDDAGSQQQALSSGTLPQLAGQVTLQELLSNPELANGKIFYIHSVNEFDKEGLWGILNSGLINSFAQGLELPRAGGSIQVAIPQDADERLQDRRSSFLGKVLDNKVRETYIYNYEQGLVGLNPDLIHPGQQLVVVTFTEDELVQIYHHFMSEGR
ncbi:hypothetical protein A8C75_15155 [Marinobacterium aestuarii]|uniref:Uncharacterized protein n=1 Tax=Marinobacterium aestuarii TaxID=1821621 RepID=A0A1A9F0K6_9GAMM|nr:hypothetical protein [Marinobacterium aestuarii]ANG63685.1 hypothetical protein A8C75_15155 [Marinobacterium aestuarii]